MPVIICQLEPFLSNDKTIELFLQESFELLYKTYPAEQFISASVNRVNKPQNATNVTEYPLRVPIYAGLWKNLWLQSAAKKITLKHGADVVLSINTSIQNKIPECLFITTLNIDFKELKKQQATFISPSIYVSNYLMKNGIAEAHIKTLRPWCANSFQPVEWEVREQTKELYTDGKEYILIDASLLDNNQVIQMLKSFSQFKKWQKTSTQILLTGMGTAHAEVEKMLAHYKYKTDIKIITEETYQNQQPVIIASAWAVLHFPPVDNSGAAIMKAMQTETPVITHKLGAIEETIGEGALYCSLETVEPLAEAMINLYKNENLRNNNIQTAKSMLKTSSADGIAALWEILDAARGKY